MIVAIEITSGAKIAHRYELVWTRLVDDGPRSLPVFDEWYDSDYLQVLPNSVELDASAGRQIEGFLDVGHFAFVHVETFGDRSNPEVPTYEATPTRMFRRNVTTKPNGMGIGLSIDPLAGEDVILPVWPDKSAGRNCFR
jgi:phenylpropionate dioxygenase-like ring-hydroxylating dioxygenase large terminal subunit